MATSFSQWEKWSERNSIAGIEYPGVYALAYTDKNISKRKFSYRPEIIYFGMTNAKGGLKSRLRQFDNTIKGKSGHGGGHRVRYKYPKYTQFVPNLYVSVLTYECNVQAIKPGDLRIMGNVVKQEYECFAVFVEKFGKLPKFNDKKRSPKK
jgi:hypothetical protein